MTQAPSKDPPKPMPASGPNPEKGVHDSSEHTQFTSPPRRVGSSQDFGDREVSHTADAKAPGHGAPGPSPEQKRSGSPD